MIPARDDHDMERLLRAAITEHQEAVMTITDTERELQRFQSSLRRTNNRRRTFLAAAASVAVIGAAVGYTAVSPGGGESRTEVAAPRALGASELQTAVQLPDGLQPSALNTVDGVVAVAAGKSLITFDPGSGRILNQVPAGEGELGGPVVAAGGGLWSGYGEPGREGYARVDAAGGRITAVADVGRAYYLASGGAGLWAVGTGNDVVRLDPENGELLDTVTLPFRPFGLWVTDEHVWAQSASGGRHVRVDPETGAISDGPTLGGSAPGVVADGLIWVPDPTTAEVVRFDAVSGEEVGRTALPGMPPTREREAGYWAAADSGSVYVTTALRGQRMLIRLDLSDGRVVDAVSLPNGPRPHLVASTGDSVFLAAGNSSDVLRLRPITR